MNNDKKGKGNITTFMGNRVDQAKSAYKSRYLANNRDQKMVSFANDLGKIKYILLVRE